MRTVFGICSDQRALQISSLGEKLIPMVGFAFWRQRVNEFLVGLN